LTAKADFPEIIAGQLAAKEVERDRDHKHGGQLTNVRLPLDMQALMDEAARGRGISRNSYMRRAIMAMVVHDLGLDWETVMANEPGVFDWERSAGIQRLRGRGYGPWRIGALIP